VGGDVIPGPMPRESLECLLRLRPPARFIHGNCELATLAQMAALEGREVAYWGTKSGKPPPEADRVYMRWTAERLYPDYESILASWPKTLRLEIGGLGPVLFCHGTPRSETEIVLRTTADDRARPVYEDLPASIVVCGHTHMPFDRMIGKARVVNAGSVGMPFGEPGAYWALLGPRVELRRTRYDLAKAAERIRATSYPQAEQDARQLLEPASEAEALAMFSKAEVGAPQPA